MTTTECPRVTYYRAQLAQQQEYLRQLEGSRDGARRYDAAKDEAAFVRLLNSFLEPHDCAQRDCAWAAANLARE